MRKEFAAAPPSAFISEMGLPKSACIASMRSRDWKATLSSAARTICARLVPRVSPTIAPRASGSHQGAPRPTKAGTTTAPPQSGTERASVSDSAELEMSPSSSRSH